MEVNKHFLWGYDWKVEEYEREEFKRWYIARVLSRGLAEDVRGVGILLIKEYLPKISLPKSIRESWEFFFSRLWVIKKYGKLTALSAFYLQHRLSEDLDCFTDEARRILEVRPLILEMLSSLGQRPKSFEPFTCASKPTS